MKIAVIGANNFPAKQGVIEHYCQELYPQLIDRKHQVELFIQPNDRYPSFSIDYHRKIKLIALLSIPSKKLNLLFNSALNTIWATFGNYDVIHIHGIAAAWFCWFPQLVSPSPVIVTCHQLDTRQSKRHPWFNWLLQQSEKLVVKHANKVVVTSAALRRYFHQKYHVRPVYIANAPASYSAPNTNYYSLRQALGLKNKPYLLYLGKFEPEQRLELLLEAFSRLQPHHCQLVLAGEISNAPKYAANLISIADRYDNVICISKIRGSHLAELVRGAKMVIDPSAGADLDLSMNLLEAMREGIPVLASDTEIHCQLLQSNRGLLFKSGKSDSLLTQLKYGMSQPSLLQAMAKKAQQYIAIYHNWDRITYKNLYLYLQLADKMPIEPEKQRAFDN